eukprot:scaffold265944_cov18-Tisochrysis_lutea.AAC.1
MAPLSMAEVSQGIHQCQTTLIMQGGATYEEIFACRIDPSFFQHPHLTRHESVTIFWLHCTSFPFHDLQAARETTNARRVTRNQGRQAYLFK